MIDVEQTTFRNVSFPVQGSPFARERCTYCLQRVLTGCEPLRFLNRPAPGAHQTWDASFLESHMAMPCDSRTVQVDSGHTKSRSRTLDWYFKRSSQPTTVPLSLTTRGLYMIMESTTNNDRFLRNSFGWLPKSILWLGSFSWCH